jgi:ERCC4-type nuclease
MKTASLRRIIYIVEDAQRFSNKGLSDQAFHQALVNMEVQDGFLVKETENLQKTAEYLLMMTKYLQRIYSVGDDEIPLDSVISTLTTCVVAG